MLKKHEEKPAEKEPEAKPAEKEPEAKVEETKWNMISAEIHKHILLYKITSII